MRSMAAIAATGLLMLALVAPVAADGDAKPCSETPELDCLHSASCTLVPTQERGKYACRDAVGPCETGFAQAGEGDIRKDCEARAGCEFQPGNCYCPPGLNCFCGGGTPAMCVERQ